MRYFVLFALFVCCLGLSAQESKPKYSGYLYPNWRKLGLSADQKQAVYKIQTEHRVKIRELEAQLEALKVQERTEAIKGLTPTQKMRLAEVGSLLDRTILKKLAEEEKKKPEEPKTPTNP